MVKDRHFRRTEPNSRAFYADTRNGGKKIGDSRFAFAVPRPFVVPASAGLRSPEKTG
jgi:hypothetical protein